MAIRTYISIITLNVNGLNAPTKRHRLDEWIRKQDPHICCLQKTHFNSRDTCKLKVRGWKKIFHANRDQKKAGVAILISDKIDFKMKTILRDKERSLHNDQRINPRRGFKNFKYLLSSTGLSLFIFCVDNLYIAVSGVLKSPTMIVLLLICSFKVVSSCLIYCGEPMLGV